MRMNRGFYTIMAAQFFSSLADNALLIVAISLLTTLHSPAWMTPLLKLFFVLSYVLLAAGRCSDQSACLFHAAVIRPAIHRYRH
jgi:hypothetical protein